MRLHAVSSLHLCPQCGVGIVRARSATSRELASSAPQDCLTVVGCCATTQGDLAVLSLHVPRDVVATWPVITAEEAIRGFCPDCGDTAAGCRILQAEVDGLRALADAELEASVL
ncbi:hypothetical protein [Prescottella agglutinans]|uniref:RNA-binding Zn-ribbon protein involved in translation (DUF1610 family) n=1 Tax=Prescottella agglutinans TaxID=1644129 RepID=A0ABT6MI48_9NOCA|nr:hypothetical protein [Prescottella agglutinans]MDH6284007.1 putative RNA-binding Zn-ribbon protein involved in translation (DUF1610 family) [Prescottella agglutinans]